MDYNNKERKQIEKHMKDPRTQAKASIMLAYLHDMKENDYESAAITIMLLETVKKLPRGVQK